jgi:two-component system, LytTR family, sensor kinase
MTARRRWLLPVAVFSVFTAFGLSKFAHFWLDDLARGHAGTLLPRLIEELTGAYAAALVFLVLAWVVPRYPLERGTWPRRLPGYVGMILLLGFGHTTLMWLSRQLLFPLAGLGAYDYGLMRFRYPMEFAIQAPDIALMVALLHAWRWYQQSRAREIEAVRLEQELSRARLERLEAQLQPHFLFNTLNVISSLMYVDPARADRMLGRLSDLLRLTFQRSPEPEVSLAKELEWLGWYLQIMQLRFGDRLTLRQAIAPDTLDLAVPRLLLQPLVENALKHGAGRQAGPATVVISSGREGDTLTLAVEDDGPGVADPAAALGNGVGLSNTAERLRTLYGPDGRLTLRNRPEGGMMVAARIPARHVQPGVAEPAGVPEQETVVALRSAASSAPPR